MKRQTVFELLDAARERPGMFGIDDQNLEPLELMIWGYQRALHTHGLDLDVPGFGQVFLCWVRLRRGWSMSRGWAHALARHARKGRTPAQLFFELVDEYRQLKPRVLEQIGELQIVRYEPQPFHVLRRLGDSGVQDDVLMTPNGSYATTLRFARAEVRRRTGVTPASKRRPSGTRRRGRRSTRGRPS